MSALLILRQDVTNYLLLRLCSGWMQSRRGDSLFPSNPDSCKWESTMGAVPLRKPGHKSPLSWLIMWWLHTKEASWENLKLLPPPSTEYAAPKLELSFRDTPSSRTLTERFCLGAEGSRQIATNVFPKELTSFATEYGEVKGFFQRSPDLIELDHRAIYAQGIV